MQYSSKQNNIIDELNLKSNYNLIPSSFKSLKINKKDDI